MAQPVSGNQFTAITAAGTTVITERPCVLYDVLIPGSFVGSVEWYDSATAAGTAAGNKIYNVVIPGLNQNRSIHVGARCRNGLVSVSTGTPTLTFTWD